MSYPTAVSVIVPIYNTANFLDTCLKSLVSQTFDSYEVICIDDCSTDGSKDIAEAYELQYPEIVRVYQNEHNVGQGRSREKGMSLANGEFILFVDSDDYISTDFISTYYEAILRRNLDIVSGGLVRDIDGRLVQEHSPTFPWCLTTYSVLCTKMFRMSFLKQNDIRFAQVRRGEDVFFNIMCYCHNPQCGSIDYAGYYCRLNRNSTTRTISHSSRFEEDIATMFSDLLATIDTESISRQQYEMIHYSFLANMINALAIYGHGSGLSSMRRKLSFFKKTENELFPTVNINPIASSISAQTGQTSKIRWSMWVLSQLYKVHLAQFVFYFFALI